MEQVLFRLHMRILSTCNRLLPYSLRRGLEGACIVTAGAVFVALFFLHITYVTNSSSAHLNCIIHGFDRAGLMNRSRPLVDAFVLKNSIDLVALRVLDSEEPHPTIQSLFSHNEDHSVDPAVSTFSYTPGLPPKESISNLVALVGDPPSNLSDRPYGDYLFAFHRGILMLTQENTSRTFRVIDLAFRKDVDCLGPPGMRLLARQVGYDIVTMNWVIAAFGGVGHLYSTRSKDLYNLNYAADFVAKKGISTQDLGRRVRYDANTARQHMKGFFSWGRNSLFSPVVMALETSLGEVAYIMYEVMKSLVLVAGRVVLPHDAYAFVLEADVSVSTSFLFDTIASRLLQFQQFLSFRTGVVFTTAFLFFMSTTLVSFILRQTQERMLRFTYLLQYHIQNRLPYLPLIFTHVVETLVFVPIIMGIYFFLFEFFSDQLLAFLVLLVVWLAEVFSVLSLRSAVSIHYFPKFFVCFFALFHIYFFCHPFGFSYIALLCTALSVFGVIMHLWNEYEVPVFMSGRLSPHQPRQMFFSARARTSEPSARAVRSRSVDRSHRPPADESPTATDTGDCIVREARSHSVDESSVRGRGGSSRHSIVLSNIYESVEARRLRLQRLPPQHALSGGALSLEEEESSARFAVFAHTH